MTPPPGGAGAGSGAGSGRVALLTGATGFLGGYLARALAEAGWRPRLLVRRPPDHPMLDGLDYECRPADLRDPVLPEGAFAGVGLVVHAAGLVKAADRRGFLATNRDAAGRLAAAAARAAPDARFVLVSSQAARAPHLSAYAASKRAGERAVRHARGDLPTAILRPGVIYGPWDREGAALFALAGRALVPVPRDPEPRLAMVHARDAADAVARFGAPDAPCGTFELSDAAPEGHGLREVLRLAAGGAPRRFLPVPDGALRIAGAGAGLAARLGRRPALFGPGKVGELLHRDWRPDPAMRPPEWLWRARIDLAEGLAEARAWARGRG